MFVTSQITTHKKLVTTLNCKLSYLQRKLKTHAYNKSIERLKVRQTEIESELKELQRELKDIQEVLKLKVKR